MPPGEPVPPLLVSMMEVVVAAATTPLEELSTGADWDLCAALLTLHAWGQRGKGGILSGNVYGRIWHKARAATLTRAQQASPLAGRPYDLRHGGVTLALNAGVPAPEVASRAGHSVEVLWRIYAGCIDGHEPLWNQRTEEALSDGRQPPQRHPGTHQA